ncbi:MAG: 4-hydroxy-tetrahydrodipicolinate reductase [Xanthomonadaceae bacterium]|nr:4-hydroxy-tetrahydrodipicolinate reductase [Xanthomonadaceae bacterium]
MTLPVRIAVNGATGRMGRAVLDLARADARFALRAAVIAAGAEQVGAPVAGVDAPGALRYAAGWGEAPGLDVVVDFSTPAGLAAALDHCEAHGVALVAGTTGLDAALERRLQQAGARIAVVHAANFSLGVAVLTRALREAAAALPGWDLEIIEAHHNRKEDAPSGTALALGRAAAAARGMTLEAEAVYAREGRPGARRTGSIGFAAVRGGDIVGEHTALLAGAGERLELVHRATDRAIFARGALAAAAWLAGRAVGVYTLDDVLAM